MNKFKPGERIILIDQETLNKNYKITKTWLGSETDVFSYYSYEGNPFASPHKILNETTGNRILATEQRLNECFISESEARLIKLHTILENDN